MIHRTAAACLLGLLAIPAASGHEGQIHTDREAARLMPLPKDDESFHFLIFGDRTGGPAEGMKVLAQAVRDSNMLDPDLVMTVGDLVEGYNEQREWEEQMKEFRDTMSGLRMPWFPVAGNHDIYWRGKDRPDTEHETNFETHFGPLWYWFAHKNCGFLVLFSDEGDPADPSKPRIFTDLAQQKFSERQLKWLKGALAAMKDLRHVFVFTHHPRWAADIYPGNNWATVHTLLREAGNVKACFAGHIHRLRYDGEKDGIEYFAMATTGGAMPGNYPGAGYLHHYNLVSVRADGIRVSTLPVGGVIDPKEFTPERLADMNLAAGAKVREPSGRLMLAEDGTGTGVYQVDFTNPSSRPLEVTLTIGAADGWRFVPDHQHAVVEPGATRRFQFDWARPQATPGAPVESPVLVVDSDFLGEKARATLPQRKVPVRVGFGPLSGEVFAPAAAAVSLAVNGGSSGVAVDSSLFDLPDGPFTLEAWVRPDVLQKNAGLVTKTEASEYGLQIQQGALVFLAHLGGDSVTVRAPEPLPAGRWSHVAGVFDGSRMTVFLDGRPVASEPAAGPRRRNALPLFLGADPDMSGRASRSFAGRLDEIRLSRSARYTGEFAPIPRHEPDAETALLFHADRLFSGLLPDHSASGAHGSPSGNAVVSPSP